MKNPLEMFGRLFCLCLAAFALAPNRVAAQTADLQLSFSNAPSVVSLGQYFKVIVSVYNNYNYGPMAATNVVVTNLLPANATLIGASASRGAVTQSGGVLTCAFGTLPFGATATLTFELKATTVGALTNFASVSSDTGDPVATNNAALWVTSVTPARFFGVGAAHALYYWGPTLTLMTNNQVLLVGQHLGHVTDLYDVATRVFNLPAGTMIGVHEDGSATLLNSGLVLLAGGGNATGAKTAELYNPATQTFQQVGDMLVYSYGHYATLQSDGTVLLCGGALSTNELFNPGSGTFSLAPTRQCAYNGIYLPSTGKFLYFGYGRAYVYDTNTATSVETSGFLQPRAYHSATLLQNGQVLIVGGQGTWGATYDSLASAELYDPVADKFTWTANLMAKRENHTACLLPDGTVLVAGGSTSQSDPFSMTNAEVYDPNGTVDVPGVGVSDTSVVEGNLGTNFMNFNVWLTTTSSFPVTVQYATSDGTAKSFTYGVGTPDYVAITGTVTFPPGSTNQIVQVPILCDQVREPDETLYLNLSQPMQAWMARATAQGTISNDDSAPTLSISPVTPVVTEGDSGVANLVYNVILSAASFDTVTVDYFTSDQTAQAGTDYVPIAGTLTYQPGETNKILIVQGIGDLVPEPDETFTLDLTNAQYAIINGGEATGTILNDDGFPGVVHHFDIAPLSGVQTQGLAFPLTITARDAFGDVVTNFSNPVRILTSTTNVVATNLDFELPTLAPWTPLTNGDNPGPYELIQYDVVGDGRHSSAFRMRINPGTDGISQNVPLAGGITYTLSVDLASAQEGGGCWVGAQAALGIGNSNGYWNMPNLCGGQSARGRIEVPFTAPSNGVYTLSLIVSYGAPWYIIPNDYFLYADNVQIAYPALAPTVLTNGFTNGVWAGMITPLQGGSNVVLLADDTQGHKGFSNPLDIQSVADLALTASSQIQGAPQLRPGMKLQFNLSVTNRGPSTAVNTLVHYDLPPNLTFLSATNLQGGISNNAGALNWAIGSVPTGSNVIATLVCRADIPGDFTNQFTVLSSMLDLNPGDNSVALSNHMDPPLLSIASSSGMEGPASITGVVFTVTSSGPSGQSVSVDYFTSDGTATNGVDYLGTNGTVTIAAGSTNATIWVFPVDNILNQPNRTFTLSLTNAVNAALSVTNATGTIVDDDPPPVVWIYGTSLLEGDSGTTNAVFQLTLSKPAIYDVVVSYHTQDGTAYKTNDYVAANSSVTFNAGSTNASIPIAVIGNTVFQLNRTFAVIVTSASYATLGTNRADGTIIDDDAVAGRLDHFVFNPVPTPQFTGRPFPITVTAVDYLGTMVSNYSGSAALTAQTDQYYSNRFAADFEDGSLAGWTNQSSSGLLCSNVTDFAALGMHSLRLTGKSVSSGYNYNYCLTKTFSNCFPTGISFYVRAAQTNALCGRLFAGVSGSAAVDFYMGRDGRIGLYGGNTFYGVRYQSNRWYRVDLQLDWTRYVTTMLLDGVLVATNVSFPSRPAYVNAIAVQNSDTGSAWFDEINVVTQSYTNLSVTPSNLAFSAGVWSNTVTINPVATNAYFTISDNTLHVGTSSKFDVRPVDARFIVPAAVNEGGSYPGQVVIPLTLAQATTIALTSSWPARLSVPATVVIPAGQTNATFSFSTIADSLLTGPQSVKISTTATNLVGSSTYIEVDDTNSTMLTLSLPSTAAETAGTLLNAGHLDSSVPALYYLTVNLASSDSSVVVQPTVILAPGSTSAVFNVTLVDDNKINGSRQVAVSASLSNSVPATNYIAVTDNEDTLLRISGPAQVSEGDAPTSYAVRISGTLTTNLALALSSSDTSRLIVPASATILAGQTSVSFPATIIDDTNYNGSENISIAAAAPGFASISTNVLLLDNEVDHFTFAAIASPQTSSVPFSITISARDIFGGPITAYNGPVTLAALGSGGPILLQPTNVTFAGGHWTGNITLFTVEPVVTLRVSDSMSIVGQSVPFTMVPPAVYLLNINAADLVYSPITERLWSLVSSNGMLIPTDPLLLQSEPAVPIGNAGFVQLTTSGDGRYIHAANNGTNAIFQPQPGAGVYRFDTLVGSIDLMWTNQGYSVLDIKAMPGNSATVAAGWWEPGVSPYERGFFIYDNGIARTNGGGGDSVEWNESGTRLYGNLLSLSPSDFSVMRVDASGLTTIRDYSPSIIGAHFTFAGGLVFAGGGIADPERGIGLPGTGGGPVAGSSAAGRFWQFQSSPGRIVAYDLATLLPIGATIMSGVSNAAGRLVQWGANGLAFRANAAQIAIARTPLVPSGGPADVGLSAVATGLPALVSNTFSCTLTISNQGPNDASNVVLAQTLPNNALLNSVVSTSGAWTQSAGGLVCWLSNITSGSSAAVNLSFIGTNAGLALLRASLTSDTIDPYRSNNLATLNISIGRVSAPDTVTVIRQVTSDIAWDAAANRIFASVPNSQLDLGNTLLSFNPLTGAYDGPIPTSTEPDKLTVSDNGQYVYAGLDADSSIQRIDVSNRIADLKFPTGFDYVSDMAVLPGNPHAVVATAHSTLAVYDDGVQRSNVVGATEYNQNYFLALTSPSNCYSTYPTGFRHIGIDASGANLLSDVRNTVVTYPDWEIKYGGGRMFTPGGRVFDPFAGTNIATVAYSGLVAPDENDWRVFYLTGSGSIWTLSALDITNLQLVGSVTISNVSGSPTRLIRWGTDGLAFRTTGGQIFLVRTTMADDRNHNGLPDSWELQYFPSLNAPNNGANDDPDHDGMSNYAEFWSGTDPLDSNSVLRIDNSSVLANGMAQIRWQTVVGRTYVVEYSSDLLSWIVLGSPVQGDGAMALVIDPTPRGQVGRRFYRIALTAF